MQNLDAGRQRETAVPSGGPESQTDAPSPPAKMTRRSSIRYAAIFLATYAILSLGSARHMSATYDEPIHIFAGYVAWHGGQIDLDYSNPPLAIRWLSLPVKNLNSGPLPS